MVIDSLTNIEHITITKGDEMLAKWTKILPFFIIEWIAKKRCERFKTYGDMPTLYRDYVYPYKGVVIYLNRDGE